MFLNPTVRRHKLSTVPVTNTLNVLRRDKTRIILPLFKQRRNRIPERYNNAKLLIIRNNDSRQIIKFSTKRNLRQNNRTRLLERHFFTVVKNSSPLRRINNHFLVNLKYFQVGTPMVLKANYRALILLTLNTSMS